MLTIIRGLPGSGKTSYAHARYSDRLILEADMFLMSNGVYVWTPEDARDARNMVDDFALRTLRIGADVVVSGCLVTHKSVQRYVHIAERFHQTWEVISVEGTGTSVHDVPSLVFASMAERWEDFPGQTIVRRT